MKLITENLNWNDLEWMKPGSIASTTSLELATAWQQACERMTSQVMVFDLTPRTGYKRMNYLSSLSDSPFPLSRSTGQCKSQSYMYLGVEWETTIYCWILSLINHKPQVQQKGALFITSIFYHFYIFIIICTCDLLQRNKVFSTKNK